MASLIILYLIKLIDQFVGTCAYYNSDGVLGYKDSLEEKVEKNRKDKKFSVKNEKIRHNKNRKDREDINKDEGVKDNVPETKPMRYHQNFIEVSIT